jgi:hypothetical protein
MVSQTVRQPLSSGQQVRIKTCCKKAAGEYFTQASYAQKDQPGGKQESAQYMLIL